MHHHALAHYYCGYIQNALDVENSEDYMNSLNRSLSLAMDEFYGYILYCL